MELNFILLETHRTCHGCIGNIKIVMKVWPVFKGPTGSSPSFRTDYLEYSWVCPSCGALHDFSVLRSNKGLSHDQEENLKNIFETSSKTLGTVGIHPTTMVRMKDHYGKSFYEANVRTKDESGTRFSIFYVDPQKGTTERVPDEVTKSPAM